MIDIKPGQQVIWTPHNNRQGIYFDARVIEVLDDGQYAEIHAYNGFRDVVAVAELREA
ncbi:hypothetical protein [Allonocardiopsis opalescens]|uniref:Uncharacterized protein n=1 Tax=Allonocardiopsis opalescens TaxID=1144618 RepID=A0A2T0PT25_9ACTN|nr:hypothetical protein [Allonocardiopsis opalescens]PRX91948.1 hypothetical protein CLV72_11221 [Allonocardiopsis opalescens]